MSKLESYLQEKKVDPRRLMATSRRIEALTPHDRVIRSAKKRAKGGKPSEADAALAAEKPRSGKPVSRPLLARALKGDTVSAAGKTRILRAVNQVLTTKKADPAELKDLF